MVAATGGSTNGALHLPAMAHECGIEFTLRDMAEVFRRTPHLADLKPSGRYVAKDMGEAGGVPVDAITAHQAIVDELKVQSDEWCFVAGGAGGVGSMAVQVAIALGARVIASAKAADFDILESFGVERANLIDYTQSDVAAAVRAITGGAGTDAALDAAGAESAKQTFKTVRDGGRVAELTGQELPQERGVKVIHIQSRPSAKRLTTLAGMFDAGELKVRVGRVFPLVEAREALAAVEQHLVAGKVVLRVD